MNKSMEDICQGDGKCFKCACMCVCVCGGGDILRSANSTSGGGGAILIRPIQRGGGGGGAILIRPIQRGGRGGGRVGGLSAFVQYSTSTGPDIAF